MSYRVDVSALMFVSHFDSMRVYINVFSHYEQIMDNATLPSRHVALCKKHPKPKTIKRAQKEPLPNDLILKPPTNPESFS